ncbi:MAG: hypothetical protein OJF50_001739 [Nitrospira sp.]|nr:hypothetical protein [Nitrospira sp.]
MVIRPSDFITLLLIQVSMKSGEDQGGSLNVWEHLSASSFPAISRNNLQGAAREA